MPFLLRFRSIGLLLVALCLSGSVPSVATAQDQPPTKDPQVGQAFAVPYRRTLTNHYLVRVRINGKGPFNFLVDTGAPALFIGTQAAKKVGLEPNPDEFWTTVDRFEIEGGIRLREIKARVEDPFQLEGMNALGLPGATIDGILGFTVLARFKMEFDPRADRMMWTRLDYEPNEPFVPKDPAARQAPAEVQAMNLLGPAMKLAAVFLGKQPEDRLQPQGVLGLILEQVGEAPETTVRITRIWPDSAAQNAGLQPGDQLTSLGRRPITTLQAAHEAIAEVKPGDEVSVVVKRGAEMLERTIRAGSGL
jgi:hypothetical protein